jgi:hypothetical protein
MTSKRIRQLGRPLPARRSLLACRAFAAPEQLLFATDTVALTQINRSGSTYVRTFRYKPGRDRST